MSFSCRSWSLDLPGCLILWKPPRITWMSSFRTQPADGGDRSRKPGLLSVDRPALAAVLLLSLPTQRWPQVSDRPRASLCRWNTNLRRCLKQLLNKQTNAELAPCEVMSTLRILIDTVYFWIFMALSLTVPTLPTAKKQSGSCADGSAESALNSPGFHWDGKNCPK